MAELRGLSQPNISRGMMKLQKLGYFEIVRKGYTGLRGALKRVIYDEKINHVDQLAISNVPLDIPTHESITMTNTKAKQQRTNKQTVSDSRITFDEALLVVSHSLKSDSDLLRLEQLVSRGISRTELIQAFEGIPS
jgi:DNA-binding transcriptional regulator GbsR (MarR family)